jgi:hypothetical protein
VTKTGEATVHRDRTGQTEAEEGEGQGEEEGGVHDVGARSVEAGRWC